MKTNKNFLVPVIIYSLGLLMVFGLSFAVGTDYYITQWLYTGFLSTILLTVSILLFVFGLIKSKRGMFVISAITSILGSGYMVLLTTILSLKEVQINSKSYILLPLSFRFFFALSAFIIILVGVITNSRNKTYNELMPREKKSQIKNEQSNSEQEIQAENTKKSPSKFKRVLANTKRINSFSYVGILKDYVGPGNENGRWINVEFKESRLLLYSNNEDDTYLTADDVESLEFEGKTDWYSSGSVSAIDCMINIVGKDGKQGTIKTPVAKWGSAQEMPHLNTDSINRALKVLGASFRIDIKLYRITFISSKGQTKTDYRIAADDEALKKECESLGEKLLKYDVIEKTPILYL